MRGERNRLGGLEQRQRVHTMYHDACCVGCKVKCAYRCSKIPYTVVPCVYSCFILVYTSTEHSMGFFTECRYDHDDWMPPLVRQQITWNSTFYLRTSHRPKNKKAAQTHDTLLATKRFPLLFPLARHTTAP